MKGKTKNWQEEFKALRSIVLSCHLTEEMKWGWPCFLSEGRNIVLIHGFKEYCALLFFKGSLLKDPKGVLFQQTANVQAARQIRFNDITQILKLKPVLKAYIKQAIEVEKSGLKVVLKKIEEYKVPPELQIKLDKNSALRSAFNGLTPGRQRAYFLYFSSAKQTTTRIARVEKCIPQILKGKGLND